MPQDVKLSPDGSVFFVADMVANGVHLVDGDHLKYVGFIPTGRGAHGLYVSRDSRVLYVSNREEGSISQIDLAKRSLIGKWQLPGGGSGEIGDFEPEDYNLDEYRVNGVLVQAMWDYNSQAFTVSDGNSQHMDLYASYTHNANGSYTYNGSTLDVYGDQLGANYNDAVTLEDYYHPANLQRKLTQPAAVMPLFVTPGMDISNAIVTNLNNKYAASAGAPAGPATH